MKQQLYYTVEVRDREGKLLKREKRKSRSYIKQWNELVCVQCRQDTVTIKDTGGTNRTITKQAFNLVMAAAATVVTYGIRVGRGSTAVTISDYALETPCAQGTGANAFEHQACTVTAPSVVGSSSSFPVKRICYNNSGATITVTEVGIYVGGHDGTSAYGFLGIRDVLVSSVDVPDGGGITVTYTIKVTV